MPENNAIKAPALQFIATSLRWSWLWLGTAVVFGLIGFGYIVFLKKDVWVASQGLMVRDEANGAVMRLGRFQSQTDMKAAQETIIELARNPQVIFHALKKIGPEPTLLGSNKNWPTAIDIENATKKIEVRAPRGAELGTTEVLYLDTKHSTRRRAHDLNVAVCDALVDRLQEVRRLRADGVLAELTAARDVAKAELQAVTDKLQTMERTAGEDLGDLRGMTDASSNTNSARIQLDAVKSEIRSVETQLKQMTLDLELAEKAFNSPEELLSPNSLVNSQPGLKKLREGLADARLNASQLQGRFTASHPLVQAASKAELQIQVRLREELGLARQAIVNDREIASQRLTALQKQEAQLTKRIESMADIRAAYANLLAEVRSRNQVLQDTERQLSEVQAARDAALSSSLVTRIDTPFSSEKPVGPGRTTILAGSALADSSSASAHCSSWCQWKVNVLVDADRTMQVKLVVVSQIDCRCVAHRTSASPQSPILTSVNWPALHQPPTGAQRTLQSTASKQPVNSNPVNSKPANGTPTTVPTRRSADAAPISESKPVENKPSAVSISPALAASPAMQPSAAAATTTATPSTQPAATQPASTQPVSAQPVSAQSVTAPARTPTVPRPVGGLERTIADAKSAANSTIDPLKKPDSPLDSKSASQQTAAPAAAAKPNTPATAAAPAATTANSADANAKPSAATATNPTATAPTAAVTKPVEAATKPSPAAGTANPQAANPQTADAPRKPLPTIPRQR